MKHLKYLFLITILIVPVFASAAIVANCEGDTCNFTNLIELANNVINFLIITGSSVFALVFMYAGYTYLTSGGDTGKIEKGRTLFTNAIVGFIIMLAAWLLVDFILTALVDPSNLSKIRLLK